VTGASTKEEDFVTSLFVASTHDYLLMFTSLGRAFTKRVYEIPEGSRGARGKALVNLLELREGERVVAVLSCESLEDQPDKPRFILFATRRGVVKKTELSAFANVRASGIIALGIDEGDQLLEARITDGSQHLLLASKGGFAIRFAEELIRPMGRTARGVRGMGLRGKDELVGMAVIGANAGAEGSRETLMTVCERGYGKRTPLSDYPQKGRAGKGVITIKTTERNGQVVGVRIVTDDDDLMMITTNGKVIRMPVDGIPTLGRNTQGVRLIKLSGDEKVVALESLAERDPEEEGGPRARAEVEVLEGQEDLSEEQNGDGDGVPEEIDDGPTTRIEREPGDDGDGGGDQGGG
jgi:DNA gyrase subunit A